MNGLLRTHKKTLLKKHFLNWKSTLDRCNPTLINIKYRIHILYY